MDANVTFSTTYVLERLEEEVAPRAGLLLDPKVLVSDLSVPEASLKVRLLSSRLSQESKMDANCLIFHWWRSRIYD
ncbi:hypothetical protein H5410_025419 [Solanum commersonii]|uniref:Uncharacterized protein n=1 Tax=Solanum commersonii TaxID=4109 RepID=A0A9J5YVX2_SOLCO|nr:hypothetical protein H5410_025419 [Solanum commersonii]